jgi:DNA-binding GntR family transcriptional regulator
MNVAKKRTPSDLLRSAAAYEQLKIDIVACVLKPGEQITENVLQKRYRLGKATLRAALARLSQDGLISSGPRRGYRVTPVTLRDVNEVFDTRAIVEPAAMKAAASVMTEHAFASLEPAIRETKKPETVKSPTAFLAASKELRLAIARGTGNFRLVRMFAQLLDESERILHLGYAHMNLTQVLSKQHESILEAVRAGNGDVAAAISAQHNRDTKLLIVNALVSSSSFMAINLHAPSEKPSRPVRMP